MALIKKSTIKDTDAEVGSKVIICSCCNNPMVSDNTKIAGYNVCSKCAASNSSLEENVIKNSPKIRKRIH